jgi:hypothetical protein
VTPSWEEDFVSSSEGTVLLISVARNGETKATGAANSSKPAKQQIAGLACSEASPDNERVSLMRITKRRHSRGI